MPGVNGPAVGFAAVGTILVWSGLKGKNWSTVLRSLISGKKPSGTTDYPISGSTPFTGTGSSAPGVQATGGASNNPANQSKGRIMAAAMGWTGSEWTALNNIVMAESGWSTTVTNPSSGAAGIAQKISGFSADYPSGNATAQITWLLVYIKGRYGDPINAWNFHLAHGWY